MDVQMYKWMESQTDGWIDRRMDGHTYITPCVLQDIIPFGSIAQKGEEKQEEKEEAEAVGGGVKVEAD